MRTVKYILPLQMALLIALGLAAILPGATYANSFSIVFEKNDQPGFRTWEDKGKNVAIDYPATWPVTSAKDREVTISKAGRGWFRLSIIDLPKNETLAKFSRHLIDRSNADNWDIKFMRDDGTQTIGGKPCRVHQYRHKKNKRLYSGYNFVNNNAGIGVQILIHAANNSAKEELLAMVNTLRFAGQTSNPQINSSPFPDIYSHFGPQKSGGSFTGHVFFKSRKNKSYPVYIAFYPVEKKWGKIKDRNELKVIGPARYTATDHRGNYTIDLDDGGNGIYYAELYDADGRRWQVRKGLKLIKHSKAGKFHHFKINN